MPDVPRRSEHELEEHESEEHELEEHELEEHELEEHELEEHALEEHEWSLQTLVDALPACISYIDAAERYRYVNKTYEAWFGLSQQAIQGKHPSAVIGEPAWAKVAGHVRRALQGERVVYETAVPRCEGGQRETHVTLAPDRGPDGAVRGTFVLVNDISDHKRTARELGEAVRLRRQSEEQLRAFFDNAPAGMGILNTELRYVAINETLAAVNGVSVEEHLGRSVREVVPLLADLAEPVIREVIEHQQPRLDLELAVEYPPGSGKMLQLAGGYFPVLGGDGEVVGVGSVVLDISARKNAEEARAKLEAQVQHAQKLESLGVLAGGIAHDFNNLLVGVLGNADLALQDLPAGAPVRQELKEIVKAAERAAELSRQMLAYSGKGRFLVEDLDLNEVVREMSHLIEASVPKRVELQIELAVDLPAVEVDATQVRQVVMNLITNAAEAVEEGGGGVRVTTGRVQADRELLAGTVLPEELEPGPYVYLDVADSGAGMDRATLARIFDPFFTTKFTGRGLGLAAVLGIIRGHEGAISVSSEPGQGTTFRVLLPSLERPPARPDEGAEAATWQGSGTVLVVDDEASVRTVARRMLERMGYAVIVARDGAEALELFRGRSAEVRFVLLDLSMPVMGGEQAARELRAIDDEVCILISSGFGEAEVAGRIAGVAGFVQKPYTYAALERALRRHG